MTLEITFYKSQRLLNYQMHRENILGNPVNSLFNHNYPIQKSLEGSKTQP